LDLAGTTRLDQTQYGHDSSARRLVDKLAAAGQLRAGFLLRVLQQGQLDLFDLAFARLLELDFADFRHVFYGSGPRPVALACRAVGIDRAVFATVFNLSRPARGGMASLSPGERADVDCTFASFTRTEAMNRFRHKPVS